MIAEHIAQKSRGIAAALLLVWVRQFAGNHSQVRLTTGGNGQRRAFCSLA